MSEHNDPFFPQNVDESIEHLSSTRQSNTRGKQHGDANAHLIHDLETFYGAERKKRQQALQRVEDRLVRHYIVQDERSVANAASSFVGDAAERQRIDLWETQRIRRIQKMKDKSTPFSNGTSFGRSVGLLLVAAVLIGSIALVLNYAHQRTMPGTSAPIAKPTPIPPTPTPTPGLSSSIGKTLYTTPANTVGFNGLSWSPNSKRVASSTINGVQIWDAADGLNQIPALLSADTISEWPYGIDWSPNSQVVAVATNKHVLLVDGQTGKVILSYGAGTTAIIQPTSSGVPYLGDQFPNSGGQGYRATAWSPDGKSMASAISYITSGAVQVWNTETGTYEFTLTLDNSYNIGAVAWSPDGQYIAATTWDTQPDNPSLAINEIIVWKVSTHQIVFRHKDNLSGSDAPVVWQPSSHNLTFVSTRTSDSTLEIWNSDTGKLVKQYVGTGTGGLGWSPDGRYLAYANSGKRSSQEVMIRDMITDKQIYTYTGHTNPINEIVWSPDGNYIASSEGNTQGALVAKVWVAR